MDTSILAPAAVLILWSLIILLWMAAVRFPAMAKSSVNLGAEPGGRGQDLEGVVPAKVQWKAHNYTHLMEQPTIFYAAIAIIAIVGAASELMVGIAWAYTVLRIAHSLWQVTINTVPIRFLIFVLSTICMIILAIHAVIVTI